MFSHTQVTPKALLSMAAHNTPFQIINLVDDDEEGFPQGHLFPKMPDHFQQPLDRFQMELGFALPRHDPIIVACMFGHASEMACRLFRNANPHSSLRLTSLKGGYMAYEMEVKKLTQGFRNGSSFLRELTNPATSRTRFSYLTRNLMEKNRRQRTPLAALFQLPGLLAH